MARGISEFGMLVMTAGFFLVFSATMMLIFIRFFVKLVNGIVEKQEQSIENLLEETREQNSYLADISEGMRDETLSRIKVLSSLSFDLSKEEVVRIIKKVRDENHIADKEATQKKIRKLLQLIHDNRNSRFDSFTFRGKRLSYYTSSDWVDQIAAVVEGEIYNEQGVNNGRAFTNVSAAYEDIKLEFYHNLIKGI